MHKICIVTGGTGGIGKATAAALATQGATVAVVGRNRAKAEAAVSDIRRAAGSQAVDLLLCDFGSLASVRGLAAEIRERYPQVDVLVNNAGAINATRTLTADGFEATFGVNHLAPFLLTNLLLDRLKASDSGRIVNVSSAAHAFPGLDFTDWQSERRKYHSMRAYAVSKAANILFTYELARRLEGTGVTANCLHPGMVDTNIYDTQERGLALRLAGPLLRRFVVPPEEGAETSVYLAAD
ncbi:MAG TPA: SDR family NAD(P)-dependent oxidoreductase, partial [Symbiobacteriaceae bacterium]|nr:SDR family NAD(P)-dependent oxidoreductase [Symbiobacteriaceae bacterium]